MNLTIYLADRYHANIRQSGGGDVAFWKEMEFVQWYMIRVLSEFYESPLLLPDSLAAVYCDTDFLSRYLPDDAAEMRDLQECLADFRRRQRSRRIAPYALMTDRDLELEMRKEQRESRTLLGEINSGIIQRPVILDQAQKRESAKYIRAVFPECRVDFKGFGRFLGYSDLNQILFWTPLLVLRYFYGKYIPKGEKILSILTAISYQAGLLHAERAIAGDNHRELASEGIRALMEKYSAA
ncbi:MAG: hypothetical protein WBM17_03550 [Anaerolineales bacterium]